MSVFLVDKDLDNLDLILKSKYIIILGKTNTGAKFRPSDWCERLYGSLRTLSDEDYENCIEKVHLVNTKESGKGVCIKCDLNDINPMLFKFFINFVKNNNLTLRAVKWLDNETTVSS